MTRTPIHNKAKTVDNGKVWRYIETVKEKTAQMSINTQEDVNRANLVLIDVMLLPEKPALGIPEMPTVVRAIPAPKIVWITRTRSHSDLTSYQVGAAPCHDKELSTWYVAQHNRKFQVPYKS